jgi:hypothetical protein
MLSFTDIVVVCLPLAAAILAVMKDSFTQEKPGDSKQEKPPKKKITPLGVAALFLALIGFGLSLHSTREARKAAQADAEHKSHITTAVDTALPEAISEARRKLNDSVSEVVNESKSKLETAIRDATQQSGAEVQAAIQSSGNAVARNLATEISQSQARINANLRTTESKIDESITRAQTRISAVVEKSDDDIKTSVTGAVNNSGHIITGVISKAVKDQTQTIGDMAKTAVGEQIMQIPLRIDQHQSGRLGGPLSDIIVKVEDVRKDRPFDVHVYHEGTKLFTQTIGPTKKEKAVQPISFTHPGTHKSYRLELTVQTQRNLFGTGLDYIVIRAMNDSPVARK